MAAASRDNEVIRTVVGGILAVPPEDCGSRPNYARADEGSSGASAVDHRPLAIAYLSGGGDCRDATRRPASPQLEARP
jgi:hypothetical protein